MASARAGQCDRAGDEQSRNETRGGRDEGVLATLCTTAFACAGDGLRGTHAGSPCAARAGGDEITPVAVTAGGRQGTGVT